MNRRVCICVPARNEQHHLPALFAGLAAQQHTGRLHVIVTLNNCSDGSDKITLQAVRDHQETLDIVADIVTLHPPDDHVGTARARALNLGAQWLQNAGAPVADQVLLSTDADATPPEHWVAANLAAIDSGADMVGGRLVAVTGPGFTEEQKSRLAWTDQYWACVRALEDRIDPVAEDPAPRHGDHTGASLAVRRLVHDAVGGIPRLRTGEDTGFVRAALASGYRLRHPPNVWIGVSTREDGRAVGGMAASMTANRHAAARNLPLLLPGADQWRDRARWRAGIRASGGTAAVARMETALPPMRNDTPVEQAVADLKDAAGCR